MTNEDVDEEIKERRLLEILKEIRKNLRKV